MPDRRVLPIGANYRRQAGIRFRVMAALVAAIHVFAEFFAEKTWMIGLRLRRGKPFAWHDTGSISAVLGLELAPIGSCGPARVFRLGRLLQIT